VAAGVASRVAGRPMGDTWSKNMEPNEIRRFEFVFLFTIFKSCMLHVIENTLFMTSIFKKDLYWLNYSE
jgi:hypothetical protein